MKFERMIVEADAIIPTVNSDIPFPIPLSVIFSPSHIAKTQPFRIITDGTIKPPLPMINALSEPVHQAYK